MLEKVVSRYKLDIYSMMKNGTISVVTMFGIAILFGVKNMMLAYPIALTSTVLGRHNFYVKSIYKIFYVMFIDILIVLCAFIASQNPMIGIVINFTAIFAILYIIVSPYDLTIYKPFLMLYIFTQYSAVNIRELPLRILSIIFGVSVIYIGNFIVKNDEVSNLGKSIERSLELINSQIDFIIKDEFNISVLNKCSKIMRQLAYRVYITRHKKYLTTNLGRIQFEIFLTIEYLNIYMKELNDKYRSKLVDIKELESVKIIIANLMEYSQERITFEEVKKTCYYSQGINNDRVSYVLDYLIVKIEELSKLSKREINKVYEEWERSDIDNLKLMLKEYLKKDSIRFKFAMRMAITMTVTLLIAEYLGFYKIIWVVITIMSIMQPYYEDTIKKTKERIIGNVIAILIVGIFINIADNKIITIAILIISLYLLYGFKEYYKISLFAAISSISIASLTENINVLLIYRIFYVIIGVFIIMLVNKYLYPYRLKDGVNQLVKKIKILDIKFIDESIDFLQNKGDVFKIRDVILHLTLLGEKLYLRNLQYNDKDISQFITKNNQFVINLGYEILLNEFLEKDEEVKELLILRRNFEN